MKTFSNIMEGNPLPKQFGTLYQWVKGPKCAIYSCHFLASWSSRMWSFAMALFLASIPEASMRISATYGLSRGAAMLLFGAIIGDWVDRTARLKAATLTMICHNTLVMICSLIILTLHIVQHETGDLDTWICYLVYAVIIVLSVTSRLMKEGRIIVIERDWIAEICQNNQHSLAVMTSSFRRIDLLTKVLAPIVTGHAMTFAGTVVACVAMAIWSLLSLVTEYFLIRRAYRIAPSLHRKKRCNRFYYEENVSPVLDEQERETSKDNTDSSLIMSEVVDGDIKSRDQKPKPCWLKLFASFDAMYRGCRKYFSYDVMYAGLALAFLYLTVLGFDEVTINYSTEQRLTESVLGLLMGAGSAFGILATLTYPFIVKRLGLPGTGVLGLGLQLTSLFLCVISIWLPGSPFDPLKKEIFKNNSIDIDVKNLTLSFIQSYESAKNGSYSNNLLRHIKDNSSTPNNLAVVSTLESTPDVSIWVLMSGVVLARFGLWTADLTIIQLFLGNVKPSERGLVNGFQDSLNQLMDFIKYGLVHIAPHSHQFGLLVIISVGFISIAWSLMFVYAVKARWKSNPKKKDEVHCDADAVLPSL